MESEPIRQVTLREQEAQAAVDAWNAEHPVGTPVRYWTGLRQGRGAASITRTPASVLGGHTAVVWVDFESACIALTHVEVRGSEACPLPTSSAASATAKRSVSSSTSSPTSPPSAETTGTIACSSSPSESTAARTGQSFSPSTGRSSPPEVRKSPFCVRRKPTFGIRAGRIVVFCTGPSKRFGRTYGMLATYFGLGPVTLGWMERR